MNNKSQIINSNDAIEVGSDTYKIQKIVNVFTGAFYDYTLKKFINEYLIRQRIYFSLNQVFKEGLDCQILKVNQPNWQKGKFKLNISVEFIPDQTESINPSSLDSIREEINHQN